MTGGFRRWRRTFVDIGLIAGFLFAISFLPPDSSRSDRDQNGNLRFCVANAADPLVSVPDGYEFRLMQAVATELQLRLQVIEVPNMGRSFNPRDWDIGRGQCDVLGGGLADSPTNHGFMAMLPNGGEVGLVRSGGPEPLAKGTEVGIYMGSAGLDRLQLSRWLRSEGLRAKPIGNLGELQAWIATGKPAIFPSQVALAQDVERHLLPDAAAKHYALAFGVWRGDVTLGRDIRAALQKALATDRNAS